MKYVIIGATAFAAHGWSRSTHDIDIFVEATPANARHLHAALSEFGYDMNDVSIDDLIEKKVLLRQYIVETDIHPYVKGTSFGSVWKDRVRERLYGVFTYFASLNQLIRMKRAAGRPKDKEDLKYLLRLRELGKNKG